MRSLSPALASLANVFKIPMSMAPVRPSITRACHETLNHQPQQPGLVTAALQSAPFSTTSAMAARKASGGSVVDKRISMCHVPAPSSYPSPESRKPLNQTKHVTANQKKKNSKLTIHFQPSSSHPLLPPPSSHSPSPPLLPQPLPPTLDHPPRVAIVPGSAAPQARTRDDAPVPEHAGCM